MPDYTLWLNNSDQTRDNEVFASLYAELRRIARSKMAGERQGGTLDTCGLLHEAWLRLEKSAPEQWRDRKQFYAAASEAMRRILTDLSPLLPMIRAIGMPLIELPEGLSEEQRRTLTEATTISPEEMKRIAPTGLTLVICNANNEVLDILVVKPDVESADYEFRISEEQREIRVFAVGSRIGKNYNYEGRTQEYYIARDQNEANAEIGSSFGEQADANQVTRSRCS